MSTPADRIQGVIRDWVPDDLLCKQDALSALAELERERDEATEERELFRKTIIEQQIIIDDLENRLNVISGVRNELRAKLSEYEQAPTVARVIFENHAREVCNAIPREYLPPVGTQLIARPTRKGEA